MSTKFQAVAESGSCSMDGTRWEVVKRCGHMHRTREAAERCLETLKNWNGTRTSCSALWYNGTIHDQNDCRI